MQIMPPMSAPINPASYVLSLDGAAVVTYSELLKLRSEIDPAAPDADTATHTKTFGTIMPATVTLRRGLDANPTIWAWHTAALEGDPAARKTCSLQLMGPSGQILLTYGLENAWLSTVQIAGPQPPPQLPVGTQTDTFVCDQIVMQPA
jgi:T4-like virus tail tube protein gp19